ncbi:MAG: hypothetical protein ACI90V_000430 [Bacillariaceae sp.]|jgi:hypothetical protein
MTSTKEVEPLSPEMATIGTTPSTMKSITKLFKGFCDPNAAVFDDDDDDDDNNNRNSDENDDDDDDDDVYHLHLHQGPSFQQSPALAEERQEVRSILSSDKTKSREIFSKNVTPATNYSNTSTSTSTNRILFPSCSADEDEDEDQEKKKTIVEKTLTSRIPQDEFDSEETSDNEISSQHQQSQSHTNHRLKRTTSVFISFVLVIAITWGGVAMIHLLQKNDGVLDDYLAKIVTSPIGQRDNITINKIGDSIVRYYKESELKEYVDRLKEIKFTDTWVEIIDGLGEYYTNNSLRRYLQPYLPSKLLPKLDEELVEKKSRIEDGAGIDSVVETESLKDITTSTEPMRLLDDVFKSKSEDVASANSIDSIRGYNELKETHSSSNFKISNNKSEQNINISTPVLNESKVSSTKSIGEEKSNNTINETTISNDTKIILDDFNGEVLSSDKDPEVFSEEVKSDEILEGVLVVNEQLVGVVGLPGNTISSDEKSTPESVLDKLKGEELDTKDKYGCSSNIVNDDGIVETTEQFIDESSSTTVSSHASDIEDRSTTDFDGTMEETETNPLDNTSAWDKTLSNDQFDTLESFITNDSIITIDNKTTAREGKEEYSTVERYESVDAEEEEKITNPLIDQQTEESTVSLPNVPAGVDAIESSTTRQSASVVSQDEGNTDELLSKLKVRRHWNSPRGWVRRKQKPVAEAKAPIIEAVSAETTATSESKEKKTVKEESSAAEAGQENENENENAATAAETEDPESSPTDDDVAQPSSTTEPDQPQEGGGEETAEAEHQQEDQQQQQPPEQPEEQNDRGEEEREEEASN